MRANTRPKHRGSDLATIEQCEFIAQRVIDARAGYLIASALQAEREKRWSYRLRRWWKAKLAQWRKPGATK